MLEVGDVGWYQLEAAFANGSAARDVEADELAMLERRLYPPEGGETGRLLEAKADAMIALDYPDSLPRMRDLPFRVPLCLVYAMSFPASSF